VDRKLEAARFHRESDFRAQAGDYLRALIPAEAAHALLPDDLDLYTALARALIFHGRALYAGPGSEAHRVKEPWKDPKTAPRSLLRGAAMLADLMPRVLSADAPIKAAAAEQCDRAADELCDFIMFATLNQTDYADMAPEPSPDLTAAKSGLRQYLLAVDADQFVKVHDEESFDGYNRHLVGLLSDDEWMASGSSDEWTSDLLRLAEQWLKLRARYPNRNSAATTDVLAAMAIDWQFEHHRKISMYKPGASHRSRRWDLTAAGFERLEALARELLSGDDALLHQYGQLLHLSIAVTRDGDSSDRMNADVGQYIHAKEAELASPALKNRPDVRLLLYRLMSRADQLLDQTRSAGHWSIELMNFSLSRREIDPIVLYRGLGQGVYSRPQGAELDRRIAALQKILADVDSSNTVLLSGSKEKLDAYYKGLLASQLEIGQRAAGIALARPGLKNRPLIDVFDAEQGIQWVFSPIVDGRSVYAVGVAHTGSGAVSLKLQLLRMSLDGNTVEKLPGISIGDTLTRQRPETRSAMNPMFIMGSCLVNDCYCAATWRHGLLFIPINGSPVEVIDEHNGLPTNATRQIAALDGTIYAGLGMEGSEGYIVAVDPTKKSVNVLASSARRDKQSPLDDSGAFEVRGMVADPPRRRLIVAIQLNAPQTQLSGLWEYKPAARQWRQLLPMRLLQTGPVADSSSENHVRRLVALSDDRVLIVTDRGVYRYDLAHDRAQIIVQGKDHRISGWGDTVLIGDWLWGGGTGSRPWGRFNLKTGGSETFPSPRENPYPFVPSYFKPIGDGSQVLVGDDFGLWVLDPAATKN
jgi:hypothetical protein